MNGLCAAYLAARGYEVQLDHELAAAGVVALGRHGRLVLGDRLVQTAWSMNTWTQPETLPVRSIGDAAAQLHARGRNWVLYEAVPSRRAQLIQARLPHVAARPVPLGGSALRAPLGSWTLLEPDLVLASSACTSPLPNGIPRLVEIKHGPPNRAYLKLYEALVRLGRYPGNADVCVDLGASPGGWTWVLATLGAAVVAVDKAPLDPAVAALPRVRVLQASAFALAPDDFPTASWLCCDVIAYPARLFELVQRWSDGRPDRTIVCTVKFQGATDHGSAAHFATLPGASVLHLDANKHELTLLRPGSVS